MYVKIEEYFELCSVFGVNDIVCMANKVGTVQYRTEHPSIDTKAYTSENSAQLT